MSAGRLENLLAAQYKDDRYAYTGGKEAFIQETLTLARAELG